MKTTYINNIPIAHGEITIVMSDHAEKVMRHSCTLAHSVKTAGVNVLLINCGLSEKRFRDHSGYPEECNPKTHFIIRSSIKGDLVGEGVELDQLIGQCKIGVVIIAGWEWASSSWRRKEKLIFFLRELMAEQNVAVIIYSQAPTKPVIGKYDRGGVGKLAMLAIAIVRDDMSTELERSIVKPPPLVVHSAEELREAERSAQLLVNKINDFRDIKPPVPSEKAKGKEYLL